MSLFDIFKGVFGLPSSDKFAYNPGFKKPVGFGDDYDDDDEPDDNVIDEFRNENPFRFQVFSGNMNNIHLYFQHQMNEIMKTFDGPWFDNGNIDDDDDIDTMNPEMEEYDEEPRNKYLKPAHRYRKDFGAVKDDSRLIRKHDNFGLYSGDALDMHKFFEQQIDNIMKRFSSSPFFSFGGGRNRLLPEETPENDNPRNRFFKPSYEKPREFTVDSDIDNESYAPEVIGKILDKEPPAQHPPSLSSRSMFRKMLPNGGIEETHKSQRDGKEEIKISRKLGDLKHVVTTVKLPDGTTTKNEEFINFDEGQLKEFNESWNKM